MSKKQKCNKYIFLLNDFNNNIKYQKIFDDKNFPYSIGKKDMIIFSIILKQITKNKIIDLKYIAKYSKQSKIKNRKNIIKIYCKKQFTLCFLYFYEYYNNDKLYHKLFQFMNYFKTNSIFDEEDILDIIYYNINFILFEIKNSDNYFTFNKCSLFNISWDYLVQIISREFEGKAIDILFKILNTLFQIIYENRNILLFFQKEDNKNKNQYISIMKISEINYFQYFINNKEKEKVKEIKNIINEIFNLIYCFNINKICTDYLLSNIKDGFTELKGENYSKEKLIYSLNKLNNQIESINNIFTKEDEIISKNDKDIYMPKRYFVFNNSKKSGIIYNPKISITSNNFILIFSFKQTESKENILYPLFSLIDEENIIFGIYLKNGRINLILKNDNVHEFEKEINLNKSHLIIIQYTKSSIKNDKFEIYINGEKLKSTNFWRTKRSNANINIGFVSEKIHNKPEYKDFTNNFIGIIGPIIFFNNKFEEEGFIDNVFKLKGCYDILLNLNSYTLIYNDIINEEINSIKDDLKNYFFNISKKIDDNILFIISPISIIKDYQISNFNYNNDNKNVDFIENIYNKNDYNKDINNSSVLSSFSTLDPPFLFNGGTYPSQDLSSAFIFIQNDGFHIITLHFEYFYNILRMLISINDQKENNNRNNSSIYYYINKSICPLFNLINHIIKPVSNIIFQYRDSLDTIGFSLYKLFKILINKGPLSSELLSNIYQFLLNLHKIYMKKINNDDSKNIVLNFMNKILVMMCDRKFFDINKYKEFDEYLIVFKTILKNNENLVNSEILDLLLDFDFILDKKDFENNNEYKQMKHDYKNLLMIFIGQIYVANLNHEYIQKVCGKKENNIVIKYKLMKIYYLYNNIKYIFSQENNNFVDEKINFPLKKNKNKSTLYNTLQKEIFFKEYKKQLNILINNHNSIIANEENLRYLELLKSIFIQLIYEQAVLIIPSQLDINYLKHNLNLSDIRIAFFNSDDLIQKKSKNNINNSNRREFYSFSIDNNIEIIGEYSNPNERKPSEFINNNFSRKNTKHKSIESPENIDLISLNTNYFINSNGKKNPKVYGLFDELIIYEDDGSLRDDSKLSLFIMKSLFGCLYDTWDKSYKLKFIKIIDDSSYENFNMCFNDFNNFKHKLFKQFVHIFDYIQNLDLNQKLMKLIFSFINQATIYKSNQNEINSRRIFIHLFEDKDTMLYLFNILSNQQDKINNNENLRKYIETVTINLFNNLFKFHPKPFIFSYIKNCFKNNNKYIIKIIKYIVDFTIRDLRKDEENNNNNSIISFYYFNRIRFINTIKKCFQKYQNNSQLLLYEDNYNLFNTMQNLIEEYSKSYIIFDPKIYTYNPNSLIYIYDKNYGDTFDEEEKQKDKDYIGRIKHEETKLINNEGLFVLIVELSLEIIYLFSTVKGEINDLATTLNKNTLIEKIFEFFYQEKHFISYYIDLHNDFFTYKQPKKHSNKIKSLSKIITEKIKKSNMIKSEHNKFFAKNPYIKDNRLNSVIVFLLFMKYQSMIIDYENKKIFKLESDDEIKKKVNDSFKNLVENSLKDVGDIFNNINKIKDDKKIKNYFKKEFDSSKENWVKKIYEEYYQYLLKIIKEKELYFVSNTLISEIEKKFLKEFEDERNNKNLKLLKERSSSISSIPSTKIKDDYYQVSENIDDNQDNNIIITDNKSESLNNFSIIEKTTLDEENQINSNILNEDNENNIEEMKNEEEEYILTNHFTDAKNQILCTKRDLIMKNFGYYFYHDYFNDKLFNKMKKKFKLLYPPSDQKNNYNNFEKQMSLNFPSTLKNYSNWNLYYPRLFFRPNKHFFNDEFYEVGHSYFCENIKKNVRDGMPIFDYGHGLLNQKNFELFEIQNNIDNDDIIGGNNIDNNTNNNINLEIDKSKACYETELLCSNSNFQGYIVLKPKYFIFQTNTSFDFKKYENDPNYILSSKKEEFSKIAKQIIIPYKFINHIIKRKFNFFNQGIELFLNNGKSYFFNLYQEEICNNFFNNITDLRKNDESFHFEVIDKPFDYFYKKKYTNKWIEKKISTLEYLLLVNKYSGRTYNDLSQYLVLPWTLKDYLDINDKKYIRNFSLPMAVQEKENLKIVKENYNFDDDDKKSYFKCHYSNSAYLAIFLFRINPFTNNQIKLQSGKFDSPYRQVLCFQGLCEVFKDHKETCELVPEYYYLIESFLNLNFNFFGILDKKLKNIVNNLKLEKGFDSLLELFLFHQNFLNSDEISSNVHKWIDNIFGENQLTDKKSIVNSYPFECYEKNMKKNIENQIKQLMQRKEQVDDLAKEIDDIKSQMMMTYLLGQCPGQLFTKSHQQYPSKSNENFYNKIFLKNEFKILSLKEDLLYMSENSYKINSENNLFYLVTTKDIFVYTKNMKQVNNLCINNIKKLHLIYSNIQDIIKNNEKNNIETEINNNNHKTKFFNQYYYKRLIFDIEECKFFFIGGYLDNSYKIYFKSKEKSMNLSIITNSLITCMKYKTNTNIYFTGHINGRIMKWKYTYIYSEKGKELDIKVSEISSLLAHRSPVSLIEIHDKLDLLISASNKDGIIFIRKIYDYELLSVIKFNNFNKNIMNINIDKEYILVTYNYLKIINKNIQKIITYSVNGIKLSKIKILNEEFNNDNLKYSLLPISIQQNDDNIFMLTINRINLIKITFKNKIDLLPIDDNILKHINKVESLEEITKKNEFMYNFENILKNNIIVSYFYDFSKHLLYCLFSNGYLFRVNLYAIEY